MVISDEATFNDICAISNIFLYLPSFSKHIVTQSFNCEFLQYYTALFPHSFDQLQLDKSEKYGGLEGAAEGSDSQQMKAYMLL